MAASNLLLIVEDTFFIKGRGVVVLPGTTELPAGTRDQPFKVWLKRPDGSELHTTATFGVPHIDPPNPDRMAQVWWLLAGLSKEEVPIGTEIWSEQ